MNIQSLVNLVLMVILCSLIFITSIEDAFSKNKPESYYQGLICNKVNGDKEVKLSDGSRADCITKTKAIEVDFQYKWAECLSQARLYGKLTNKSPVCYLIVNSKKERYINRFNLSNSCPKIEIRLINE